MGGGFHVFSLKETGAENTSQVSVNIMTSLFKGSHRHRFVIIYFWRVCP